MPSSTSATNTPPASRPITVAGVKDRLIGLQGWLTAAAACEQRYDDEKIAGVILDQISDMEMLLGDFRILPCQIVSAPDGVYPLEESDLPVQEEAPRNFYRERWDNFFSYTLPLRPVREVQRLRLMLGTLVVATVPTNWFSLDKDTGVFHLIPVAGSIASFAAVWWAAAIYGATGHGHVPAGLAFDYVVGLPEGWQLQTRYRNLRLALEKHAACQVLKDIKELYDAGLLTSSVNSYGVTQTLNYSRFKDTIEALEADVAKFVDSFGDKNSTFAMTCA